MINDKFIDQFEKKTIKKNKFIMYLYSIILKVFTRYYCIMFSNPKLTKFAVFIN